MTAYATTRPPLALVTNTVDAMGEQPRRSTRRSTGRLAEQEDGLSPMKEAAAKPRAAAKGTAASTQTIAAGKGKRKLSKLSSERSGSSGANGTRPGSADRRCIDYDEDDDGFMFTRTKAKKPRASKAAAEAAAAAAASLTEDEPEPEPKPLQVRKARSKATEPPSREELAPETPARKGRGRPPTKAKGHDIAHEEGRRQREPARTPEPKTQMGGDVTKIALPFADTPVIRRNKEMRKKGADGSRRSSLSMRGRRASSLIDSGTSNALPHAEVPIAEFYKHIEGGLPEPRRMRQLLTWCATRALGEKPAFGAKDANAQLAAHEIKQQLLQDFAAQSELSDWFSREDRPRGGQSLRPNPRNVANLSKIKDLETRIARLKAERETWSSLLKQPSSSSTTTPLLLAPLPPSSASSSSSPSSASSSHVLHTISAAAATQHLSPSDSAALTILLRTTASSSATTTTTQKDSTDAAAATAAAPTTATPHDPPPSATTTAGRGSLVAARTTTVAARAEFDVDRLADAAHILAQHLAHAEGVGRRVLRAAADTLEGRRRRRDREGSGGVSTTDRGGADDDESQIGTRDVLRALSRVDP